MGTIISPEEAFKDDSSIMSAKAINDAGYDKTKDSRVAPEVKISKIYGRCGAVVIVGRENDKEVSKSITIEEALLRSQALVEMVKKPWKYPSDIREVRSILTMFLNAIDQARTQLNLVR